MREYFASDHAYGVAGSTVAPLYIIPPAGTGTGSQTYTVPTPNVVGVGGFNFSPLATNAPITLSGGAAADTSVTPSAVSLIANQPSTFTVSVSNVHGSGTQVSSATAGLQEALNRASGQNGGAVIVDGKWASLGGTTAMITGAANPTGSAVFIVDNRGAVPNVYAWNGTAFIADAGALIGANGQSFIPYIATENLTLSTSGTTTDTTGNLLHANSIIMAVSGTVSVTIATATDWKMGDATTAGRFSAADSTLTAGEAVPKTSFPPVQIGTGVASATTGVYQAAAAKVRVTTTGTPSAGAVRITVFGFTIVNATS